MDGSYGGRAEWNGPVCVCLGLVGLSLLCSRRCGKSSGEQSFCLRSAPCRIYGGFAQSQTVAARAGRTTPEKRVRNVRAIPILLLF